MEGVRVEHVNNQIFHRNLKRQNLNVLNFIFLILTAQLWVNLLEFLVISFFICKIGVIILATNFLGNLHSY